MLFYSWRIKDFWNLWKPNADKYFSAFSHYEEAFIMCLTPFGAFSGLMCEGSQTDITRAAQKSKMLKQTDSEDIQAAEQVCTEAGASDGKRRCNWHAMRQEGAKWCKSAENDILSRKAAVLWLRQLSLIEHFVSWEKRDSFVFFWVIRKKKIVSSVLGG